MRPSEMKQNDKEGGLRIITKIKIINLPNPGNLGHNDTKKIIIIIIRIMTYNDRLEPHPPPKNQLRIKTLTASIKN